MAFSGYALFGIVLTWEMPNPEPRRNPRCELFVDII